MEIRKMDCASCGAPIQVSCDSDFLTCPYCQAQLTLVRNENEMILKVNEKVSQTIQQSGNATQDVIRDGTQVTQSELKRLQIAQDLSILQLQLTNIQAELRSLQRGKMDQVTQKQFYDLSHQEHDLKQRIQTLQNALIPAQPMAQRVEAVSAPVTYRQPEKKVKSGKGFIFTGAPMLIIGGLLFILFFIIQLSNKEGVDQNFSGFVGAQFLCPIPLIVIGAILLVIGLVQRSKAKTK